MARKLLDKLYPWASHYRWAVFTNLPDGVTLVSAEVALEERTSTSPEAWTDVSASVDGSATPFSPAVVTYTAEDGTVYTDAAVRWKPPRDADGDPVPGAGLFRWRIRAVGSDGDDYPAVVFVDLAP